MKSANTPTPSCDGLPRSPGVNLGPGARLLLLAILVGGGGCAALKKEPPCGPLDAAQGLCERSPDTPPRQPTAARQSSVPASGLPSPRPAKPRLPRVVPPPAKEPAPKSSPAPSLSLSEEAQAFVRSTGGITAVLLDVYDPANQPATPEGQAIADERRRARMERHATQPLEKQRIRFRALVNAERAMLGLPAIPRSSALDRVAQAHVEDLEKHPRKEGCDLHSWSDDGPWRPCCYTDDHAEAECMWKKPSEIASYPGLGYEISAWYSATMTPEFAVDAWRKHSPSHFAVMTNRGQWENAIWRAMGVGISGHYAVVWFGEESDSD